MDGRTEAFRVQANFLDELVRFATESLEAFHRHARLVENDESDLLDSVGGAQEVLQKLTKIVDIGSPAQLTVGFMRLKRVTLARRKWGLYKGIEPSQV